MAAAKALGSGVRNCPSFEPSFEECHSWEQTSLGLPSLPAPFLASTKHAPVPTVSPRYGWACARCKHNQSIFRIRWRVTTQAQRVAHTSAPVES